MRTRSVIAAAALILGATGCSYRVRGGYYGARYYGANYAPAPSYAYAAPQPTTVVDQPAAPQTVYADSGQPLYLPSSNFDLRTVQAIVVRTSDGRQMTLTPRDLQAVSQGQVALNIPAGVSSGTVTVYANGREITVPFQVRISGAGVGAPAITLPQSGGSYAQPVAQQPVVDPSCGAVTGTWSGVIRGNDPNVSATLALQMGADCATVRGTLYWRSAVSGSNDRVVAGTYNAATRTLVLADQQVANAAVANGWQFCRIEQYVLTLGPDNAGLTGQYSSSQCRDRASIALRRTQ